MKKILLLMLVALSANMVFGQTGDNKKKVVVYVMNEGTQPIYKVLRDELVAAFTHSSTYVSVDRSPSFLKSLGKEVEHQEYVKNSQRLAVVKQEGAELLCMAEVSIIAGQTYVYVALIDAEKAIVVKTAKAKVASLRTVADAFQVARLIVIQLTENHTNESFFAWGVLNVGQIDDHYKIATGFTGRKGIFWQTGLGWFADVGVMLTEVDNVVPYWSCGMKLYPYKNLFLSAGYGTLGHSKFNSMNNEEVNWQTDDVHQGVTFMLGYDLVLGNKFSPKSSFFLSIGGGICHDFQTNQWSKTPIFELKIGAVWKR